MKRRMRGFGLLIESEIEIPGCLPADDFAIQPDVTITRQVREMQSDQPLYRMEHGEIIFAPADVGKFCIGEKSITMQLLPDADMAYATALLIATALPALLWLRGHFILHAAGIRMPGEQGVTAIVGASGSGKTTIARQLLDAGATLVGDDGLCLTMGAKQIFASGLPGGVHYWKGEERIFEPYAGPQADPLPLQRVILLTERQDRESLQFVQNVDVVEMLLRNAHRPKIPLLLGRQGDLIAISSAIARQVHVLKWTRAEGDLAIDESYFRDMVIKNTLGEKQ
jgi:hypothetical protein